MGDEPVGVLGDLRLDALIGKIDLHGAHIPDRAKVHPAPLVLAAVRAPPVFDVFVCDLIRAAAGGHRHALAVGQEHEFRLPEGGGLRVHRPVAVALIAPELAVRVKAGLPQAEPPLHVVVHGDGHAGRVPVVPVSVRDGGAVTSTVDEAAGLIGEGVVLRKMIGSKRLVGHQHCVAVDVGLRGGKGVLQVILPRVLGHIGSLNIGVVPGKAPGQTAHGGLVSESLLGPQLRGHLHQALEQLLGLGLDVQPGLGAHMVRADPLIAPGLVVHGEHDLLFPQGLHGLRVQLHAPDGGDVGAAPVEVEAAVVVHEEVRVPEGKASLDLLPVPAQGVLRAVEIAGLIALAGGEIEPVPRRAHVRRVVEHRDRRLQRMIFPVHHVVRDIEAPGHGGEEIIAAFEELQRGVCRLPVNRESGLSQARHIGHLKIVFIG